MNLGMVGLGGMGANMVERLREHGHTVETYARTNPERTADSLVELATKLPQPRIIWLMIPSGDPTEMAFQTMLGLLEDGDIIVDGGNSNFRDSQRRAAEAAKKHVSFLDAGVSGGSWGVEEG
jgi:6-phosphogluconate dehydrogenase